MNMVEKQVINNYIKDMKPDEAQNLVRHLPSKLMSDELARRERLNSDKLSAIDLILQGK